MAPPKSPKFRGFTNEEKAAMRERAQEAKASGEDGERAVLEKIAAMKGLDHALAQRFHALVKTSSPELSPKTWYGMPAYANNEGKTVCFFQDAHKFKTRYAMIGFSDKAKLDDGHLWPVYFALTELNAAEEKEIVDLLRKAVS